MGEKYQKFVKFVRRQEEGVKQYKEKKFEREKVRLERRTELEEVRARGRVAEAKARPSGGGWGGMFTQRSGPQAPPRGVIRRKVPRKAARGRVLFDAQGRPVSVRNAPAVRRARRSKRSIAQPQQDPFAPSFRL